MDAIGIQSASPPGTGHQSPSTRHQSASPGTSQTGTWLPCTGQLGTGQPITGQPGTSHQAQVTGHLSSRLWSSSSDYQAPVTGFRSMSLDYQAPGTSQSPDTSHRATRHWSTGHLGTRHQSIHLAPVIRQQTLGTEHRMANYRQRSSEQSLANEPQNSVNTQRILLLLEPDFSAISNSSIVIDPPTNTWESSNKQTSLNRQSRRDQPKSKHKSKKRRRYRSSSSSSSSTSSTLSSHKRSKKSKRSRHSHKKRRRRLAASSSLQSIKDYGRYKRQRHPSPQVVDVQSTEQPARIIEETPIIHSDNVVQHLSKDSDSEPEIEIRHFDTRYV